MDADAFDEKLYHHANLWMLYNDYALQHFDNSISFNQCGHTTTIACIISLNEPEL